MLEPSEIVKCFKEVGVEFFTGVPDSTMAGFCDFLVEELPEANHVIAANEGTATAIACGQHITSGSVPVVYMQNSGIGNAVNPILSLADSSVYSIPLILLIGWRGRPGAQDEPQHIKQGAVTEQLLKLMGIPSKLIGASIEELRDSVLWAINYAQTMAAPVALLVPDSIVINRVPSEKEITTRQLQLTRLEAIEVILERLGDSKPVVSSTGKISREVFQVANELKLERLPKFLTIGSMGHSSQIAFGMGLGNPELDLVCIDGDGAAIMHLGGMTTLGASSSSNLLHIVLNNGVHESVGGQPTTAPDLFLSEVALASGYSRVAGPLMNRASLAATVEEFSAIRGSRFIEVLVGGRAKPELGRPTLSPVDNLSEFRKLLDGKWEAD